MTFTSRIRHALRDRTAERNERYLSQSTSLVDLELRERELESGRFHGRNFR